MLSRFKKLGRDGKGRGGRFIIAINRFPELNRQTAENESIGEVDQGHLPIKDDDRL